MHPRVVRHREVPPAAYSLVLMLTLAPRPRPEPSGRARALTGAVTALASSPANPRDPVRGDQCLFVSGTQVRAGRSRTRCRRGRTIAVDNSGQTVYAVAGRRIYATSDGGVTWSHKTWSLPPRRRHRPGQPCRSLCGNGGRPGVSENGRGHRVAGGGLVPPRATRLPWRPARATPRTWPATQAHSGPPTAAETWTCLQRYRPGARSTSTSWYPTSAQPETVTPPAAARPVAISARAATAARPGLVAGTRSRA